MKKLTKCLLIFLLSLILYSGCAGNPQIVYKDVPADCMVVKRDTMKNILETVIEKDSQLRECLEREKIK